MAATRKELDAAVRGTALDRAVQWVAPEWGLRRMRARAAMALAGQYTGASTSKRSLSGWKPRNGSADADLLPDMPTLRDRSRDLQRNAPIAAGAVNTVVTKTVGTGLALSPLPNREVLGWSEQQAKTWASAVDMRWRAWAETTRCDAARRSNFYQLQSLAFRAVLEAGDVFAVLPMVTHRGLRATAIQLIESERVCNPDGKADTARMAGGVEMDEYGAAVRYHVLKQHPGALHSISREWLAIEAAGVRTGRRNVLHLFDPRRPGQSRGVPYLAPVIEALKQLDRYSEAEINAAVVSGMFAVFVTSEAGAGFEPLSSAATGVSPVGADGKAAGWDGKLTPGLVADLAPGESITSANPGRPNAQFDPFVSAVLRQVGMALELPYEVLTKHFASSYSAARAALLEAWQFVSGRRAFLSASFCQPVYEVWLEEQIAAGAISAPGWFTDPMLRWAYASAAWIGDGPGSIDPEKEVRAAAARVELGVSTREKESLLWDGSDWRRNHEQLAREQRAREADRLAEEPPAVLGRDAQESRESPEGTNE